MSNVKLSSVWWSRDFLLILLFHVCVCMHVARLSVCVSYSSRLQTDSADAGVCQTPHLVDGLCELRLSVYYYYIAWSLWTEQPLLTITRLRHAGSFPDFKKGRQAQSFLAKCFCAVKRQYSVFIFCQRQKMWRPGAERGKKERKRLQDYLI